MFNLSKSKQMGLNMLSKDSFAVKVTDLCEFLNRPTQLNGGAILYCLKGQATVSLNVQDYEITAGAEMFLLPRSIFALVKASNSFQVVLFTFSHHMFENAAYRLDTAFFHFLSTSPVYRHSPQSDEMARCGFEYLMMIYKDEKNGFREEIISNCLRNILLIISDKVRREYLGLQHEEDNRKVELLHRFADLVTIHFVHHRDVAFYADELCISKSYLASVTRSLVGKTPKQLIDNRIVQEIKILLATSNIPLQEIVDRLNFPDQSYLGRFFKRHAGISPSEYRRRR